MRRWLIKDVKDEHYIKAELQLVCIAMALCVPLYIILSYQTLYARTAAPTRQRAPRAARRDTCGRGRSLCVRACLFARCAAAAAPLCLCL